MLEDGSICGTGVPTQQGAYGVLDHCIRARRFRFLASLAAELGACIE